MTDYPLEVHNLLLVKRKTLSIAESCTGGLISHLLTEHSGASTYLLASVVAYSVFAKNKILNIDKQLIHKYGTISPETAIAMAKSVREITGSDYSLSTTGNLGPTSIEGKELGLLYIAFFDGQDMIVKKMILSKDRQTNKKEAAFLSLEMMHNYLLHIT